MVNADFQFIHLSSENQWPDKASLVFTYAFYFICLLISALYPETVIAASKEVLVYPLVDGLSESCNIP